MEFVSVGVKSGIMRNIQFEAITNHQWVVNLSSIFIPPILLCLYWALNNQFGINNCMSRGGSDC